MFRTTEEGETARYGVGRVPSKTRHGPAHIQKTPAPLGAF